MINLDLVIPERFVRVPGEPARHRGPTRSINAPAVAEPTPSKRLHNIAVAERAVIDTDLTAKTDLAQHGREE